MSLKKVYHLSSIMKFMVFAVFSILAVSQSQFRPLPAQDVVPPTFRCKRIVTLSVAFHNSYFNKKAKQCLFCPPRSLVAKSGKQREAACVVRFAFKMPYSK